MTFELRNADGSEAEMSGNGLRCLAHAAIDAGAVTARSGDSFGVLTPAGRREVHVRDLEDGWMWASTEMGEVKVVGEDERLQRGPRPAVSSTSATLTWWSSALTLVRSTWPRSARR